MEHVLRKFLYLDEAALDDYFASVFGHTYEEEHIKTNTSGSLEGNLGIEVGPASASVGGKKGSDVERERSTKFTPAAKFQKLYRELEKATSFKYFETMDDGTWKTIRRNDLLEIGVAFRFSNVREIGKIAKQAEELAELAEKFGKSIIDAEAQEAITGFQMLSKFTTQNNVPAVLALAQDPEFKFVAYLSEDCIRASLNKGDEVTVFGKVKRMLGDGEKLELVNIIPDVQALANNRAQRRKIGAKKVEMPAALKDTIKSPAGILEVLAIYN